MFKNKHKTANTNGVYAIGVHICSNLECPPVRIVEGKCDGAHKTKHWGVCVCDKGYVAKGSNCVACPDGQFSDGIHECTDCEAGTYHASTNDTTCSPCPSGSYCVNGKAYECPEHAICSDTGFECFPGFTTTTTACTCASGKYIDGDTCKKCPEHASCSDTGFECNEGFTTTPTGYICPDGKYIDDNMICRECPVQECPDDNVCCNLTGPNDICGNPTPKLGFKGGYSNQCYSCDINAGAPLTTASECAKCDATDTPRIMLGGYCFLKLDCKENEFQSSFQCTSCSNKEAYYTSSEECSKCKDTDNNPTRQMYGNYCGLIDCGTDSDYFRDSIGSCISCTSTSAYRASAEECATCKDMNGHPLRTMIDDACYLKLECGEGQFQTVTGCVSCSGGGIYMATSEECSKCKDTDNNPTRQMFGNYCGLIDCGTGMLHDNAGYCHSCMFDYPIETTECDRCPEREEYEIGEGHKECVLKSEVCHAQGSFRNEDGVCISCSSPKSVSASAAECASCDVTSYPRYLDSDGLCQQYICDEHRACQEECVARQQIIEALTGFIEDLQSERANHLALREAHAVARDNYRQEYDDRMTLYQASDCPDCTQHHQDCTDLEEQLANLDVEIHNIKVAIDAAHGGMVSSYNEIESLRAKITQLESDLAQTDCPSAECEQITDQLAAKRADLESFQNKYNEYKVTFDLKKVELEALNTERERVEIDYANGDCANNCVECHNKCNVLQVRLNELATEIVREQTKIDEETEIIAQQEAQEAKAAFDIENEKQKRELLGCPDCQKVKEECIANS